MQVLMTEEWTGTVARAARWGWWGFNTDRVKRLQKMLRDEGRAAGGSASLLSVDVETVGGSGNLDSPRLSARGTKQVGGCGWVGVGVNVGVCVCVRVRVRVRACAHNACVHVVCARRRVYGRVRTYTGVR